jgi:hypothetical protein
MSEEEANAKSIRQRIEVEDALLNNRTTIFLAMNGLWAASVGLGQDSSFRIGVGVLGVVVSLLWWICAWQSQRVIAALTREILVSTRLEELVQAKLKRFRWLWLRPTDILAWWLPWIFIVAWSILLIWLIRQS